MQEYLCLGNKTRKLVIARLEGFIIWRRIEH